MNRYQSYTPIGINYKPFTPNFDKWFEILDTQQKKFDEFNQQLSMLNADSELDPEYADAWNTYIQTTKDQVKAGFRGDVNEGNQLMKRKMEELTKEVTTGLYKDMETRKQDFSLASADFNEKIKGQSAQRQAYFLDQWKYEKSMYDKEGKLNRINAPNVSEDPLLDKNLQEWASKLKPEEVETKVKQIRYFQDKEGKTVPMVDSKGQFTGSAQWIDEAYRYTKGIKREDFNVMAQQYIMSNPAFVEDVQIRAWYQEKQMDPFQKEQLKQTYIFKKENELKELELNKANLLSGKRADGSAILASQDLLFLNRALLLRESDELDEELKEAITKQYDNKIESVQDNIKNYSDRGALIEKTIEDLTGSVYNFVDRTQKAHDLFDINPDYQMRFKAANDHIENELNRQNALRRSQIAAASRIRAAEMSRVPVEAPNVGYGFEQTVPTGAGKESPVTIYQKTKEGVEAADKELKGAMTNLGFGSSNESQPSAFAGYSSVKSEFRAYNPVSNAGFNTSQKVDPKEAYTRAKSLPSNLATMKDSEARAVLKQSGFNIAPNEPVFQYAIKLNDFKNAYEKQTTYKQQYDKLNTSLNDSGAIDRMDSWLKEQYTKYKNSYTGPAQKLTYEEFVKKVHTGDMKWQREIVGNEYANKALKTASLIASTLNLAVYPIHWYQFGEYDVSKEYKKVFNKEIEKMDKFQTQDYNMASGYSNPDPQSESYMMSKALVPSVLNLFKNTSLLVDPINNTNAQFRTIDGDGNFSVAENKKASQAFITAKQEQTTVYPVVVGGVASYNISFSDPKTKEVYTVTTKAPASHHGTLVSYAKNLLNEATRTGDEAGKKYAADLYASLIGLKSSPFKDNPDYYATDEVVYNPDTGNRNGKVLNTFKEDGVTFGVIKQGNYYYSGMQHQNGWSVVPIKGGIVYSSTDPMEVTRLMLGDLMYTQDYKHTGRASQVNTIVKEQQDDFDDNDE